MGSDVLLKMRELGELALANLASVGLDTKMDPRVLREVGTVGKCLATCCTLIRFGLSQMNLSVELKVRFAGKALEKNSLDLIKEAEYVFVDV